jgi:hypothetical protein
MDVGLGLLKRKAELARVADMSCARAAARLLA